MVLKTYSKMLSGAKNFIYTDHKNLTFRTFSVQRVLRWRLYIDEYDTLLTYIQGKKNVLVDCFSRLPLMEKPTAGDKERQGTGGTLIDFKKIELPKDSEEILDGKTFFSSDYNRNEWSMTKESFVNLLEDTVYTECMLNLPHDLPNPITTINIINHQARDIRLQEQVRNDCPQT